MSINFTKLSPAQLDKYDTITEKFENLVRKQSKTLALNELERDFMNYVGQHFYSTSSRALIDNPSLACLDKAFELSKRVHSQGGLL